MVKHINLAIPNKTDPNFLASIVKSLYANDARLTALNLEECSITDANMLRLADAIGENSRLKELILATNQLTYLSMEDFSQSLLKCTAITSLNLAENALGSEGAGILAKAFHGGLR
jgi:Ran GTPase-activating protein (RanGAP) involved in mRNA processing and transport